MADENVYRFTMSGQLFEFDGSPERLMGDEVLLIEEVTGGTTAQWATRLEESEVTGRDMLLLAYLAKYRLNPVLEWRHFIKSVAPFTIALAPAEEPAKPAAAKSTRPRAKAPETTTS